jgi:hypothetical protein
MNKQTKLLYVAFLSITIFFSCSKDDNIDTSSDLYLSIPDKSFEKILIAEGIDSDGVVNQQMLRSDAENVQELDLELSEIGVIQNLSGIEGFTSLKKLQANQHDIEEIDLSANRYLEEIHLAGNYLSSIDVSKNTNLISLDLTANLLTGITGLTELVKLENLNLSFNYFEELSINNQALEVLHIGNNDLISLDISTALNLINVLLTSNKLIALDISSNKKLQTLLVSDNQLQSINLSEHISLTHVYIASNFLEDLDVSNNQNLVELKIDRNPSLSCIKIANGQRIPSVTLSNHQVLNDFCN